MISNGVGDVAKYLSEAASSIFKTDDSNVPWSGSGTPFSGEPTAYYVGVQDRNVFLTKGRLRLLPSCFENFCHKDLS